MKQTAILPLLAALLLATACTKIIEFNGEETEPIPVLTSMPETDSTLYVRLTYSSFFLERNIFRAINNADFSVELNGSEPNALFTLQDSGYYRSSLILHENDTLTLHVSIPGHDKITAGCRVPYRPVISNLTATPDIHFDTIIYYDHDYDSTTPVYIYGEIDFSFLLHDRPGNNEYYMLRAYSNNSTNEELPRFSISVDDNIIFDMNPVEDYFDIGINPDFSHGEEVFFTDQRINGQNHTIHGNVQVYYQTYHNNTDIHLEICTLSRDTYLYYITKKSQDENGSILDFISEPVQIHSNIEGGIGILGPKSITHHKLYTLSDSITPHTTK